jgi:hypothetical protein
MIIEAGYDVVQLLDASVNKSARSRRGLWMLTTDEHLRVIAQATIVAEMSLPVEAYIDEVSIALRGSPVPVRYIVLAYATKRPLDDSFWLHAVDERLVSDGWLGEVELLGQVVFARSGFLSTVPRFSFRDYIGLEHLPRSVSVLGPHDIGCECVACVHFEQMLRENRLRRAGTSA